MAIKAFSKGTTYKHISARDLDMLVIKVQYVGSDYTKMKVALVYKSNGEVCEVLNVKILKEHYQNWYIA